MRSNKTTALPTFDINVLLNRMRNVNINGNGVLDLAEVFYFAPYAGGHTGSTNININGKIFMLEYNFYGYSPKNMKMITQPNGGGKVFSRYDKEMIRYYFRRADAGSQANNMLSIYFPHYYYELFETHMNF